MRNCVESDNFFSVVCLKDEAERRNAVQHVIQTIKEWLSSKTSEEYMRLLRVYIGGLVRMASQNPFEDIRLAFSNLVEELKGLSILIPEHYDPSDDQPSEYGPSSFVPPSKLPSLSKDEDTTRFLQELFLSKGRITHISRSLSYYSTYASRFANVFDTLMFGGGPLPQSWRHYLAIMGASRHNSRYFVVNQQVEFYQSGGDIKWLEGIDHAPVKIQKLSLLNALLAHQPWLIKQQHIIELTNGEDSWSLPELVQAVSILSTFHCLAGFAWGFGITVEVDRRGDYSSNVLSLPISPEEVEGDENEIRQSTTELVHRLKAYSDKSDTESISSVSSTSSDAQKFFEESEIGWTPKARATASEKKKKNVNDFSHYHGGVEMNHEDFNVKSQDYKVFRLQEFSWEEQGFSLLNRYYPGIGDQFDELFTETINLTDCYLFDSTNVDTSPFRQAIWYYVLRLKGMCHDDYEYSQVNTCLNMTLKKYIKKVACYPELVTRGEYANMGIELFDAEKAHINFLILESRRQAELLYFLHAIMLYKGN